VKIEEQVIHISHNIALLMVVLASKIGPFGEVEDSDSDIKSQGKSRDNEDP
jgi:hypothetical protein